VRLWNIENGEAGKFQALSFNLGEAAAGTISFSPDGKI